MTELNKNANYVADIKRILSLARQKTYSAINATMVETYWQIGKRIVEEEQNGKERANYGEAILKKPFHCSQCRIWKRFFLCQPA